MTQLYQRAQPLARYVAGPLAAWLLPSAILIGSVVAVTLFAARFAAQLPEAETGLPEMPSLGVGASAPGTTRVDAPSSDALVETNFAFGFLEFDRSPNLSDGVPDFNSRPLHQPRVGDASAGE